MLDSILQVLQCEHKLKQGVRLELETGSVLGALGHIVSLVEDYDTVSVVERVVGAHRLIQHVVVAHQDQVSLPSSLLVHVERTNGELFGDLMQVLDIVWLSWHHLGALRVLMEELTLATLDRPVAPVLQIVALSRQNEQS